jgi:hypothetical protein
VRRPEQDGEARRHAIALEQRDALRRLGSACHGSERGRRRQPSKCHQAAVTAPSTRACSFVLRVHHGWAQPVGSCPLATSGTI